MLRETNPISFRAASLVRRMVMKTRVLIPRVWLSLFVGGVLLLMGGCQEPVGGMGKSPVILTITGQSAWGLYVDVYNSSIVGKVADEQFWVTIKSTYRNPDLTSTFADVYLSEYRVTYYRIDGSTDVPEPFTVHFTGAVPAGGTYDHQTLVLRKEAKLKSPLKELAFGGGEGVIDLNAVVEFFGEDLMGNKVSAKYVLYMRAMDI